MSNVTDQPQTLFLTDINLIEAQHWVDLISGVDCNGQEMILEPYQTVWISNRTGQR